MIDVLLATCNSHLYLADQLDSLMVQECQDFQILIRDAASTDDTLEIIRKYQERYPGKIRFLGSQKSKTAENFSELLAASQGELAMFCDHDDVWLPHKISHTLAKYREAEKWYGPETPILVFTDARIADRNLKLLSPSTFLYQCLDLTQLTLNRLISQNIPPGNTMMFNRALIDLASPIPDEAVMHDHWIALTAAALGKIIYLNEATLDYRQHDGNVYGAIRYSALNMLRKSCAGKERIRERLDRNIRQAAAFGRRYASRLSAPDREMLTALEHWDECDFTSKRKILLKYRILKAGFLRNLGMFALI